MVDQGLRCLTLCGQAPIFVSMTMTLKDLRELAELLNQFDTAMAQLRTEIGAALKKARLERGLSLRAAADLLECDFSNLRRCEEGWAFSPSILERVLKCYPKVPLSGTVPKEEPELIG